MIFFCKDKEKAAQFVKDLLLTFGVDSMSITITNLGISGAFYVRIVTDGSSDGTVKSWVQNYYGLRTSISTENIPDG